MDFVQQSWEFVGGLTARQKILLAGSALAVAGTLAIFVTILGRSDYRTLSEDLPETEAQDIAQQLESRRIPYELSPNRRVIRVPSARLDEARLLLASGGMPRTGRLGFEVFDSPDWGSSDFAEKVKYQRALEGELARTIQTLEEVTAVRVHLVLPRESLFTERQREGKAAVVLRLRGGQISSQAADAIVNLVAAAVDGLSPDKVTVVSADGGTPLLARGQGRTGPQAAPSELEAALAAKLVETLTPVVGEGKITANVNVEYDLSRIEDQQESYVPDSETESGRRDGFPVSKSTRHITRPAGRIRRITAAVVVDDAVETQGSADGESDRREEVRRARTPEEMQRIESLARAAIGFDEQRGDFLAVENLSFQVAAWEVPPPPTQLGLAIDFLRRWRGEFRYVVLFFLFCAIYFLVIRPIKKQLLQSFDQAARRRGTTSLASEGAAPSPVAAMAGNATGVNPRGEDTGPVAAQADQTVMLTRQLADKVRKEPAGATWLIQTWLRQTEAHR